MIASMTGYAHITQEIASLEGENGTVNRRLSVELRSVNARFLDFHFRIANEVRVCEPAVRAVLMKKLRRGKVEVCIDIQRSEVLPHPTILNPTTLKQLVALEQQVLDQSPQAHRLSVAEMLRWPGVLTEKSDLSPNKNAHLCKAVVQCTQQALAELAQTRIREGTQLKETLLERVAKMEACIAQITSRAPDLLIQQRQRTIERLLAALGDVTATGTPSIPAEETAQRIRQEVTLYGIRIDTSEELARLAAHLTETRRLLEEGGQVGKRLDFMMQELNREANTLGAKAVSKELTDTSMTLKLLIEQMREQIQNLE